MTCIASIFQSISIDFYLFFRIILYGRNADRYRAILYSRNDLRERIRWVATACIVDKKNEWMNACILLVPNCCFVVLCCTITSYSNYCTVQKQIGDERMKPNCLHDSYRVSGRNRRVGCSNGTFITKQPPLIGICAYFVPLCQAFCNNRWQWGLTTS